MVVLGGNYVVARFVLLFWVVARVFLGVDRVIWAVAVWLLWCYG